MGVSTQVRIPLKIIINIVLIRLDQSSSLREEELNHSVVVLGCQWQEAQLLLPVEHSKWMWLVVLKAKETASQKYRVGTILDSKIGKIKVSNPMALFVPLEQSTIRKIRHPIHLTTPITVIKTLLRTEVPLKLFKGLQVRNQCKNQAIC